MSKRDGWRKTIALVALLAGAFNLSLAQRQGVGAGAGVAPDNLPSHSSSDIAGDPRVPGMKDKLENARNAERQRKLVEDTDKLLEMATQLKEEVDKTDKNTLSLDVIKRADEIERLAHAVKQRMKG